MKFTQKLGLCIFLCLSLFMVLISIVRIIGYDTYRNRIDPTWYIFLQCLEASIIASISAFRPLFARGEGLRNTDEKKNEGRLLPPLIKEWLLRKSKTVCMVRMGRKWSRGSTRGALVQVGSDASISL